MSTPRPDGIVPPHIRDRIQKTPRYRFDAPGIAVVILALAVGAGWAASVIIAALGTPLDAEAAALLTGIGQMLVEAVVIYLSYRVGVTAANRSGETA